MSFVGKSIISIDQLNLDSIEELFEVADRLEPIVQRKKVTRILEGAVLGNLFFEASTRTRISFGAAFARLGGSVCDTTGFAFSSINKGESLYDSSRVISGYVDAIVLRHPEDDSMAKFAEATNVPLINGGNGTGEHPTQALLDLYTLSKEFRRLGKTIDNCSILLFGDLRNGRTVHSLVKALSVYTNICFIFVSPKGFSLPPDLLNLITERGHDCENYTNFDFDTSNVDVIYATRMQRERFNEGDQIGGYSDTLRINKSIVDEQFAKDVVIMHPLPRDSQEEAYDLSNDLNQDTRLAIFRQTDNGLQIRMALFALIMGVEDQIVGSMKDVSWVRGRIFVGLNDADLMRTR